MPTGGINPKNVREYLACDKIFACGGSWMVKGDMIKAGEFDKIEAMTKEAVEIVKRSKRIRIADLRMRETLTLC